MNDTLKTRIMALVLAVDVTAAFMAPFSQFWMGLACGTTICILADQMLIAIDSEDDDDPSGSAG